MEIKMPQLSESMAGGKLLRWNVAVGDYVRAEDILAEVEADKANMEIEAPVGGKVVALHGTPGEEIPVGRALIELDEAALPADGALADRTTRTETHAPELESTLDKRMARLAEERKNQS